MTSDLILATLIRVSDLIRVRDRFPSIGFQPIQGTEGKRSLTRIKSDPD